MNYLAVGDLHIKTDNVEEINILLLEIIRIFSLNSFDYIILLGDILHTHEKILTQCLNRALNFIEKCSNLAPTYILVGNHDLTSQNLFLSDSHWMNVLKTYKNITIVDKVTFINNDVLLCPYVSPGRFLEALNSCNKNWNDCKIIFAHQEFKGAKMGAIISIEGDEWDEKNPQVISGHIHDIQKINKIFYPGAPLQHSFGDSSKRIICSINSDTLKITEYPLNVPKKCIIHTEIQNFKIPVTELEKSDIKVKLNGTSEEFKIFKQSNEYKEALKKNIKFQLITPEKDKTFQESSSSSINFLNILEELIEKSSNDIILKNLYNEIVLEKLIV
jgi:DNA repair exonuclease SbcCD nuclease subunit